MGSTAEERRVPFTLCERYSRLCSWRPMRVRRFSTPEPVQLVVNWSCRGIRFASSSASAASIASGNGERSTPLIFLRMEQPKAQFWRGCSIALTASTQARLNCGERHRRSGANPLKGPILCFGNTETVVWQLARVRRHCASSRPGGFQTTSRHFKNIIPVTVIRSLNFAAASQAPGTFAVWLVRIVCDSCRTSRRRHARRGKVSFHDGKCPRPATANSRRGRTDALPNSKLVIAFVIRIAEERAGIIAPESVSGGSRLATRTPHLRKILGRRLPIQAGLFDIGRSSTGKLRGASPRQHRR